MQAQGLKMLGLEEDMICVLWTMVERTDPESEWAPFWRTLPSQLVTGLSCPQELLECLRGSPGFEEIISARQVGFGPVTFCLWQGCGNVDAGTAGVVGGGLHLLFVSSICLDMGPCELACLRQKVVGL